MTPRRVESSRLWIVIAICRSSSPAALTHLLSFQKTQLFAEDSSVAGASSSFTARLTLLPKG
jgi:hypothetical protein